MNMTIIDLLDQHAITQPKKICLINGSTAITYQQLLIELNSLAHKLATQFNKGEIILVKHVNPMKQLYLLLAAAKAGLITVLVDPLSMENITEEIMKKAGAKCCIDENYHLSAGINSCLPNIDEKDVFLGALSSGSGGTPKLIWRDHRSWVKAFPEQSKVFNISSVDKLYLVGSLVYTANLNSCLHLLHEGGTVVISNQAFPRSWVKEIKEHHITAIFMVPSNYRILLKAIKAPIREVHSLVSAGAKIDLNTVKELLTFFPEADFHEYYGAGEVGHVSHATWEDLLKYPDSVGKAFPGVKFWTDNEEVWVESPYLAPDYLPKASVGDLGTINEEGYLFLLGKKDNVINKSGVKVFAEQVEKVLSLFPGVTEVAVEGVTDPLKGQKVVAWIERDKSLVNETELRSYCRQKLSKHYRPQQYRFIDKMPKNASGKINRELLR